MATAGGGRAWGLALTLVADACTVLGLSVLVAQHRRFARLQSDDTPPPQQGQGDGKRDDGDDSDKGASGAAAARSGGKLGPRWTAATVVFLAASIVATAIPLFTQQQSRYHQAIMVWKQISRSPTARSHSAGSAMGAGMVTVALNAFLSNPVIHALVHDLLVTALGAIVALRYVLWSPDKAGSDGEAAAVRQREHMSFAVAAITSLLVLGGGLGWAGVTNAGLGVTAVCRIAAAALGVGAAAAAALGCHDTSPASQAFLSLQVAGLGARCALWIASADGSWTMGVERMEAVSATQRVAAVAALAIYALALLAGILSASATTHWSRHVGPVVVAVAAGAAAAAPKDIVLQAAAALSMMSVMAYVIVGAAPGVAAVALTVTLLTNCYAPLPFAPEDSLRV